MASRAIAEKTDVGQCAVIMINVDESVYPYSTLAIFTRTPDT